MIERWLMRLEHLSWQSPWRWPRGFQIVLWLVCAGVGAAFAWPLWQDAWARHAQTLAQQEDRQRLQQELTQLMQHGRSLQQRVERAASLAEGDVLSAALLQWTVLAQEEGVSLRQLGWHAATDTSAQAPVALPTVRLQLEGPFSRWLAWWRRAGDGDVVARLSELRVEPLAERRVRVSMTVRLPQPTQAAQAASPRDGGVPALTAHAFAVSRDAFDRDPFDREAWQRDAAQAVRAHPGFAAVAAHWERARQPLERFALEDLRYIGRLRGSARDVALVRASPQAGAGEAGADEVHGIGVGDYLGPHLGRVLAVRDDALLLREWRRDAAGVWRAYEAQLAFTGEAR